nr:D-2-hydroxyglutarate dehydrogenase, mitochondrial-like [Rhipicephalus microplus]
MTPVSGQTLKTYCTRLPVSSMGIGKLVRVCGQFGRRLMSSSSRVHENRGPFATLSDVDVATFERLLGPSAVLTEPADMEAFNVDWLRTCRGSGAAVLLPRSTEEVSAVLSHCHSRRLAVCPQGGNTGLVGGSVPVFDELVLSTARMAKVNTIDPLSGAVSCEAGCVLEALDTQVAEKASLMVPLDLGAKGSCHIGGNVATNAGGLRLLRYGPLHGSVLGLETVLADGTILDTMQTLRKDNTGLDLKHLFIGSEGILGVITRVAIQCVPRPCSTCVAFLVQGQVKPWKKERFLHEQVRDHGTCSQESTKTDDSPERKAHGNDKCNYLRFFLKGDATLAIVGLPTTEACYKDTIDLFKKRFGDRTRLKQEYFSRLHTLPSIRSSDPSALRKLYDQVIINIRGLETLGELWRLRESIGEALRHDGYVYKYDISVPLATYMDVVSLVRERVRGTCAMRVCGFGHMGDSNLHLNITAAGWDDTLLQCIEPFVYEWTASVRGSISAEHGIGLHKKRFLHLCKTPAALQAMRSLKCAFDPLGILNPYKMLPPSS